MKKRLATLEISILVIALLAFSIFLFRDSNFQSMTGQGLFEVYDQTNGMSCTNQDGICVNKNIFGSYSCGVFETKSSTYSCPKGQGCCLKITSIPQVGDDFSTVGLSNEPQIEITQSEEVSDYKGILGEAYAELSANKNIFAGYEVQYDDSGSLVYELTNAKTILTVGVNTLITDQTDNTITISEPSSTDTKKLECRCKTKTGKEGDCKTMLPGGCKVEKMTSGPYYGCVGICTGTDCSGNSCSFYKKGESIGELVKQ